MDIPGVLGCRTAGCGTGNRVSADSRSGVGAEGNVERVVKGASGDVLDFHLPPPTCDLRPFSHPSPPPLFQFRIASTSQHSTSITAHILPPASFASASSIATASLPTYAFPPHRARAAMASGTSTKRLLREYQAVQRELGLLPAHPHRSPSANPDLLELRPWDVEGEDLTEWTAILRGPPSGSYTSGVFELSITIPPSYPTKPPSISFKTKIFHPNISFSTGEICLDILKAQWTPAWSLSSACTAILALLDSPEPDSPLNVDAATLYRAGDKRAYDSMCRMYTHLYAHNHLQD